MFLLAAFAPQSSRAFMFGSDISIVGGFQPVTYQGGLLYGYSSELSGTGKYPYYNGVDYNYAYSTDANVAQYRGYWGLMLLQFPPITPNSYFGIVMTAPSPDAASFVSAPAVDVSGAGYIRVKMGNQACISCDRYYGGVVAAARNFRLVLANSVDARNLYVDPNTDLNASALCYADIALREPVGPNLPLVYPNRMDGLFTYTLPLNSSTFTCARGTLSQALSLLSLVAIEVRVDTNPEIAVLADMYWSVDVEMPSVSRISFGN